MVFGYVAGGSGDEVTLRATGPRSTAGACCPACCAGCARSRRRHGARSGDRAAGAHRALGAAPPGHDEGELATARARARRRHDLHHEHRRPSIAIEEIAPRGRPVVVPALRLQRPRHHPRPGRAGRGGGRLGAGGHRRRAGARAAGGGRAQPLRAAARAGHGQPAAARAPRSSRPRTAVRGLDRLHRRRLGAGLDLGRPRLAGLALAPAGDARRASCIPTTPRAPSTTARGR